MGDRALETMERSNVHARTLPVLHKLASHIMDNNPLMNDNLD